MTETKRVFSQKLTEEDVKQAIANLIAQGQSPSLRNIRGHLGYGSLSTIRKLKSTLETPQTGRKAHIDKLDYSTLEERILALEEVVKNLAIIKIQENENSISKVPSAEMIALQAEVNHLKDDKLHIYENFSKHLERIEKQLVSAKRIIAERNAEIDSLRTDLTEAKQIIIAKNTEKELRAQLATTRQELETLDAECLRVSSQVCDQEKTINELNDDLSALYELWQQAVAQEEKPIVLHYNPSQAKTIALELQQQGFNARDICWELALHYRLGTEKEKPYTETQIRVWFKEPFQ